MSHKIKTGSPGRSKLLAAGLAALIFQEIIS